MMMTYTVSEVAKILELSPGRVRSYARDGWVRAERGSRGEYRFSFQDLVLLRTVKGLRANRISARKVKDALQHLRAAMSEGYPMSAVQVSTEGRALVVQDDDTRWDPSSGQVLFDFDVAELEAKVASLKPRDPPTRPNFDESMRSEDWLELGLELAASDPKRARDAFRRALERDPRHTEARLQLGRLLWQKGWGAEAEVHFEVAWALDETSPRAAFHLGIFREDQNRDTEAEALYQQALSHDPGFKAAHLALARLYERTGHKVRAIRSLNAFRDSSQ